MGLFDKKQCSICGKDIGLLGNRKLEDGNLCKDCASKLSPFFYERRHSTVQEIAKQLEYREANKSEVAKLNPTDCVEGTTKVYVDKTAKKFIVTRSTNWRSQNPDVIALSQVDDVTYKINERKTEIKKELEDGTEVSYDPKQYEYEYTFSVTIKVNSPWFDDIVFEVVDRDQATAKDEVYKEYFDRVQKIRELLVPGKYEKETFEIETENTGDTWKCECGHEGNTGNFCSACGKPRPAAQKWFCPSCGRENDGAFCSNCGTKKPENTKWFCPSCGTENSGNFCSKCGTKKPNF